MDGDPPKGEGAGCAWRNPRGRPSRNSATEVRRRPNQSRKEQNCFDVVWRKKIGGEEVCLGLHVIERSKSTSGLPSRALRRGLQVKVGSGLHTYIPKGTWLPGGIYGMEYTQREVSKLREVHALDQNIMWALDHSLVELPPMSPREHGMPPNAVIIPDLRWSGSVLMINNGNQPNCKLVAEICAKGPHGRYFWKVSFQTLRDVYGKEELIAQYIYHQ